MSHHKNLVLAAIALGALVAATPSMAQTAAPSGWWQNLRRELTSPSTAPTPRPNQPAACACVRG